MFHYEEYDFGSNVESMFELKTKVKASPEKEKARYPRAEGSEEQQGSEEQLYTKSFQRNSGYERENSG